MSAGTTAFIRLLTGPDEKIFHICTDGLAKSIMFRDEKDFICGMNDIPICMTGCNITLYCFCLMGNHVHFVLKGVEKDCICFIRKYKRLRTLRLQKKYGDYMPLHDAGISLNNINDDEYLKNAIAYVMRNPLAAGLKTMPGEYPWSSAHLYFASKSMSEESSPVKSFTLKNLRRILNSRIILPPEYKIRNEETVLPESYVDYKSVNSLFGSPKRLLYYLSSCNDTAMEVDSTQLITRMTYHDYELIPELRRICIEKFGKQEFEAVSLKDKILAAKELKKRFGANPKQISRLTGIPADIIRGAV